MNELKFYISNRSKKTENTITLLHNILSQRFGKGYLLEIIDIIENPDQCLRDNIFATPTLIKSTPPPERKMIGDISNEQHIISILNLA